ncbi:MAG: amino acid ABC transporter ATP-binding/permease protein [Treponema sp.]
MNTDSHRRSGLAIMGRLIILVKPLIPVMVLAVTAGVVGFLCAIFITVLGGQALLVVLKRTLPAGTAVGSPFLGLSVQCAIAALIVLAVLRGILHCIEQYCNHFIAFKLLAIIRHNVFTALRRLAPAKLEGKDKGNLISIITTDIELLEVFYAHTISPIIIALLTCICMLLFIGSYSVFAALVACVAYIVVGVAIPLQNGKKTAAVGMRFRNQFGSLNSFVLESLRGLDEIMQYNTGERIQKRLQVQSDALAQDGLFLSNQGGRQRTYTNAIMLFFSLTQLLLSIALFRAGSIDFSGVLAISISMISSFGPVLALAQLSNNLNQTLASGERVISLLEETPLTQDIPSDSRTRSFTGAQAAHIDFSYANEKIFTDYSMAIKKDCITGIHGASGSGKSTLLKLLMRFWEVQKGSILISDENIGTIPTDELRNMESFVTQESHLFKGTIADNIKIGKATASMDEVIAAAKKASIHDFILSLAQGYETEVGELGDTLSGGEKQRIGLARAFLHDAPFMLLDEPTSNLDALNEKIILKSLEEASAGKTIVLVSHRESTLHIADTVVKMGGQRVS